VRAVAMAETMAAERVAVNMVAARVGSDAGAIWIAHHAMRRAMLSARRRAPWPIQR